MSQLYNVFDVFLFIFKCLPFRWLGGRAQASFVMFLMFSSLFSNFCFLRPGSSPLCNAFNVFLHFQISAFLLAGRPGRNAHKAVLPPFWVFCPGSKCFCLRFGVFVRPTVFLSGLNVDLYYFWCFRPGLKMVIIVSIFS